MKQETKDMFLYLVSLACLSFSCDVFCLQNVPFFNLIIIFLGISERINYKFLNEQIQPKQFNSLFHALHQ